MEYNCEMSINLERKIIKYNFQFNACINYRLKGTVKHFAMCLFLLKEKKNQICIKIPHETKINYVKPIRLWKIQSNYEILLFTNTLTPWSMECTFVEQQIQWESKFENMTLFIQPVRCSMFHCSSFNPVQVEMMRVHGIWIISNFVNRPNCR